MEMNKLAVVGAIVISGLGITGLTVLIALDRPVEYYVTAFVTIAGFVTTILVTARGLEKQNEKLQKIERNTNGNTSALIKAALSSSSLSTEEIDRIILESGINSESKNEF